MRALDTREKIFAAEAIVVTGHFDPLTAEHARRLESLKEPGRELLVVITSPPHPILPAQARAELVAGLAVVDRVVIAEDVVREEAADFERTQELVQHVRSRQ
jgi:glycerol-3-phosphate cytidylyltransferase-like family protein